MVGEQVGVEVAGVDVGDDDRTIDVRAVGQLDTGHPVRGLRDRHDVGAGDDLDAEPEARAPAEPS